MKSNAKFFSGLGLGLLISFIFLNVNTLKSEKPNTANTLVVQSTQGDESETNGVSCSQDEAQTLINAYKSYITAPGAKMATEGGVIDRRVLKGILGTSSDDLIRFRFYKSGDNMGIVFFPKFNDPAESRLRTGYQSFCPNMCN